MCIQCFFSGARLSLTNIQALSKLYPTKEESAKISKVIKERILQVATEKTTTEKVERLVWDKPEALFIALGKIPSCTLRLACWSKTRFEWFVVSIFARLTLLCLDQVHNWSTKKESMTLHPT